MAARFAVRVCYTAMKSAFELGRDVSFRSVSFIRMAQRWDLLVPLAAVAIFFLIAGVRSVRHPVADGRRRLRILLLGAVFSLAPIVVQSLRAIRNGEELLAWAGPLEYFATLLPLLLFPLVLAYVILVRRAQDIHATVRQGFQGMLVGRGLLFVQMLVTAAAIGLVTVAPANLAVDATAFVAIVVLRPLASWLVSWLERDAAEQSLRKLTTSLLTLMEERTLLHTVTRRTAAALQLQRIAFLLNREGEFVPAVSIGYASESPPAMAENSGIVRYLKLLQKAAPVYFDDAKSWIHSIHPEEQAPIQVHETQVVVPVAVKQQLLAMLVLGPRQRDVPYTKRDLELLDALAKQTAISLTNARLADTRPEAESNDGQQTYAPDFAAEITRFDEPRVGPNDLYQV